MVRMLAAWVVLAAVIFVSPAAAQNQPSETVVIFDVKPMSAPKPALKYQLLPELIEMNPGNPILGYLKCFMEQQNFFFNKDFAAEREKWQMAPLSELKKAQVLKQYAGGPMSQTDEAARLDTPDWQILLKSKKEGVRLLLPEVQQLRM